MFYAVLKNILTNVFNIYVLKNVRFLTYSSVISSVRSRGNSYPV